MKNQNEEMLARRLLKDEATLFDEFPDTNMGAKGAAKNFRGSRYNIGVHNYQSPSGGNYLYDGCAKS